ncbi:unnamed protein product, partial [Allacma fusca]
VKGRGGLTGWTTLARQVNILTPGILTVWNGKQSQATAKVRLNN